MKNLLLLSACLLALAARPAAAQAQAPDIVVVRVYETRGTVHFVITRGESKSEDAEFPKSGPYDRRMAIANEGYHKVFSKLYQEGYALQSNFTNVDGSASTTDSFTTLLFVKKP
ncbi:MAG: hypothetical protein ACRYFR_01035 [Janthinobacterium lividum]